MPISAALRAQVCQRAHFACEYCGVSETDVGGELTVDHFQPQSKGGSDSLENLLYCCARCNLYKSDYWPADTSAPPLWHPRREPSSQHFLLDVEGVVIALTGTGEFTIQHLNLNRLPLIAHRRRARRLNMPYSIAAQERHLMRSVIGLLNDHAALVSTQQRLLSAMVELLRRTSAQWRRKTDEHEP